MKIKTSHSTRIFGMTAVQVGILFTLGTCVIVSIGSTLAIIGYSSFFLNAPLIEQPIPSVMPTSTRIHPFQTLTPTFTPSPTLTRLPTATITSTPTPWFQEDGNSYIPKENELPSDFKLYAPCSGRSQEANAVYTYACFTSDYPNNHHTEDAYSVGYGVWIFNTEALAISGYNSVTPEWILSIR